MQLARPVSNASMNRAIAEYATRFHAALGPEHGAASPLCAWLLLALVAPTAKGEARADLERVLGCPADNAAALADRVLQDAPPGIRLAVAAWNDPEKVGRMLARWRDGLPRAVERGPIPSQVTADTWARATTGGRIDGLPIQIDPSAVLLLASALTANSEWKHWFQLQPAKELGKSPWAGLVNNVLFDYVGRAGTILETEAAGIVATQVKTAEEGFLVASVIAAPDVPHANVIAAAHEVAAAADGRRDAVKNVSLFDLPLGEGHSWTITEEEFETTDPDVRLQSADVCLPAWDAPVRTVDLMQHAAFGVRAAADALFAALPPAKDPYAARAAQSTTARFDRPGFSAASVTVIETVPTMAGMQGTVARTFVGRKRHAAVRFGRPYAVVAIAQARYGTAWSGLPFLSAWVTRPIEPDTREKYV